MPSHDATPRSIHGPRTGRSGVHHVVQGAAAHGLQREVLRTRAKAMVRGHHLKQRPAHWPAAERSRARPTESRRASTQPYPSSDPTPPDAPSSQSQSSLSPAPPICRGQQQPRGPNDLPLRRERESSSSRARAASPTTMRSSPARLSPTAPKRSTTPARKTAPTAWRMCRTSPSLRAPI